MCEPLPGAGEWGRTRALHPCCAVAWEHSAPAENGRLRGIKTARREQEPSGHKGKGEDKNVNAKAARRSPRSLRLSMIVL